VTQVQLRQAEALAMVNDEHGAEDHRAPEQDHSLGKVVGYMQVMAVVRVFAGEDVLGGHSDVLIHDEATAHEEEVGQVGQWLDVEVEVGVRICIGADDGLLVWFGLVRKVARIELRILTRPSLGYNDRLIFVIRVQYEYGFFVSSPMRDHHDLRRGRHWRRFKDEPVSSAEPHGMITYRM
jgi:hypothetical protein